jgi:hypothetical protein
LQSGSCIDCKGSAANEVIPAASEANPAATNTTVAAINTTSTMIFDATIENSVSNSNQSSSSSSSSSSSQTFKDSSSCSKTVISIQCPCGGGKRAESIFFDKAAQKHFYNDIRASLLSQTNLDAVIHMDSLPELRASLQRWIIYNGLLWVVA